jgi:hypothetical protein
MISSDGLFKDAQLLIVNWTFNIQKAQYAMKYVVLGGGVTRFQWL